MATTAQTAIAEITAAQARPYAPSWVDRVTDWVRGLRLHYPAVYLIPAVILFAATTVIKWVDGSYQAAYVAGNVDGLYKFGPFFFYPFHIVPELVTFYALALIHYLDDVAKRALKTYCPAMRIDEKEYNELEYKLTTMPALPTLLWSLGGAVFAALVLLALGYWLPAFMSRLILFTSPAAVAIESGVFILLWSIWGALIYHTIRQLRLVSDIYNGYTRIDLFNLDPLYAFSWLTARTGIGWVAATYAFILTAPGLMENAITLGIMAFNIVFAVIAFGWPLVGIHRKLEAAKSERLYAANQSFEALSGELRRRTEGGDFARMAEMKDGMEAVARERDVLSQVHTWPWQQETVGGLSTALFLPIIIWVITRLLEKVL
jgi:hypothetical protein